MEGSRARVRPGQLLSITRASGAVSGRCKSTDMVSEEDTQVGIPEQREVGSADTVGMQALQVV